MIFLGLFCHNGLVDVGKRLVSFSLNLAVVWPSPRASEVAEGNQTAKISLTKISIQRKIIMTNVIFIHAGVNCKKGKLTEVC